MSLDHSESSKALIAEMLETIKTSVDIDSLKEYRNFVRKNVPFHLRSYFMAWLFMQIEQAVPAKNPVLGRKQSRNQKGARGQGENVKNRQRVVPETDSTVKEKKESFPRLNDDEAINIFISVGRNRRVYARDLLGLLVNTVGIQREDVGSIRIKDTCSFVQVRKELAVEVIDALNGKEFRGRTLGVNYATSRKDQAVQSEGRSDTDIYEDSALDVVSEFTE